VELTWIEWDHAKPGVQLSEERTVTGVNAGSLRRSSLTGEPLAEGPLMANLDLVRELAGEAGHLAVLATIRPDLTVHASLVSAGVLEDPETGEPVVGAVVAGNARKLGYLRASGRATAAFSQGFRWVAVEGPVRLQGPDDVSPTPPRVDTPTLLRSVFVAAGGTHDDWDEYDRVMAEERRCAVLVTARTVSTNR
jgi:hypothetical protein